MAEAQLQPQQDAPALQAPDGFELDKYFGDERQRQSKPSEYGTDDPCRRFPIVDFETNGTAPFAKALKDCITKEEKQLRSAVTAYVRQLYGNSQSQVREYNYERHALISMPVFLGRSGNEVELFHTWKRQSACCSLPYGQTTMACWQAARLSGPRFD